MLEIILTVLAWRKGWGPRALAPMGIAIGGAIVIGVAAALTGADEAGVKAICLLADVGVYVALGIMLANPPRPLAASGDPSQVTPWVG